MAIFLEDATVFCTHLLAFVVLDYITGVMCAIADGRLSSNVGYVGIMRKTLIFALVGVGNLLDVHVLGEAGVVRSAVIFFYLSNEGISLMENAGAGWLQAFLFELKSRLGFEIRLLINGAYFNKCFTN